MSVCLATPYYIILLLFGEHKMKEIKVVFDVKNYFATPFTADIIFGHIMWALAYNEGPHIVSSILDSFQSNNYAPLMVSDGFPCLRNSCGHNSNTSKMNNLSCKKSCSSKWKNSSSGISDDNKNLSEKDITFFLPMPKTPISLEDKKSIYERFSGDFQDIDYLSAKILAYPFIDEKVLFNLWRGHKSLLEAVFSGKVCPLNMEMKSCSCEENHNCEFLSPEYCTSFYKPKWKIESNLKFSASVNRISGNTEHINEPFEVFSADSLYFYIKFDEEKIPWHILKEAILSMAKSGFGKKATSGMGALDNLDFIEIMPSEENLDCFLNLSSSYVPYENIPEGFYETDVKSGWPGGEFAYTNKKTKYPIVMIKSGALFYGSPYKIYGQILPDIHPEINQIRQYAYAYALGVRHD